MAWIDDAISQQEWESDENDDRVMWDFPSPYWKVKKKDGSIGYKLCEPYDPESATVHHPYIKKHESYQIAFEFKALYFCFEDVIRYENKYPSITNEYGQNELGKTLQRAIVAEEHLAREKEKTAALEHSVIQLREQSAAFPNLLSEKESLIQELSLEISHLKKHPLCTGKGARLKVCSMRRDGESEHDIILALKKSLSSAQIGALLHDNALGVGEEAHKQYVKRALNKDDPNCTTP